MRFEVKPLAGVGPALLGMTREQVRAAMGVPARPFRKGIKGPDVDGFLESAFQVFYEADRPVAEFIELSRGGPVEPWLNGLTVFETPAEDLISRLSQTWAIDDRDPEQGYSYIFPAVELALWRPTLPEDDSDPEGRYFSTVAVAVKGYFSERNG